MTKILAEELTKLDHIKVKATMEEDVEVLEVDMEVIEEVEVVAEVALEEIEVVAVVVAEVVVIKITQFL